MTLATPLHAYLLSNLALLYWMKFNFYFQFLETMQFKYNEKAKENEIFVIGTCGFDSIPADMGIVYTQKKFPGKFVNFSDEFLRQK